jgi:hypothetical protein
MIVFVNFRRSGSSARFTMDDYRQKVLILNGVIYSEQNRGSHCLSGAKMRGLLRRHAEVERTTITMASSVTLSGIPMTAVGSNGIVGIGWVGVCQSWMTYKSSDGVRFGGTLVPSRHGVSRMTSPVVRGNGRRCSSGLTIHLSEITQS